MTLLLICSLLIGTTAAQDTVAFWFPDIINNRVLGFAASANGDAAPLRVIAGDRTGLSRPISVVIGPHGEIYVANLRGKSVTVYSADAAGNTPPLRVIEGPSTGLEGPRGIAVGADGAVYVSNASEDLGISMTNISRSRVTVFAPDARGDAPPVRTIWGSKTGLFDAAGIAVDRSGRLYVGSYYGARIHVFEPGADGNASSRVIRGGPPTRTPPLNAYALALGPDGRLYAGDFRIVFILSPDARDSTPAERIIRGPNTDLGVSSAIAVDSRSRIAVFDAGSGKITIYATTANGDAGPVQTIAGPATRPARPSQPATPPLRRPDRPPPSIVVFPPGATGDTPPSRTIAGENTMLATPASLAISRDTLFVLSCQGRVTIYGPKADGNVAPAELPTGWSLYTAAAVGLALAGDTIYVTGRSMHYKFGEAAVSVYVRSDSAFRKTLELDGSRTTGLVRDKSGRLYRGFNSGFDVIDPLSLERVPTVGWLTGTESGLFGAGSFAADSRGLLYVPNADDAVRVYDREPTRDLRPRLTLSGRHTGLDNPIAAAIGPGDTLFVANRGPAYGPSVTVYRPGASGDEEPIRRIGGVRTGLGVVWALTVDGSGSVYISNNPEGETSCFPAGY